MSRVSINDVVVVNVPVRDVWDAIKDPAEHAGWHPYVTAISGEHRLGAERTCTVLVGKKTAETRERCIEDDAEQRIAWLVEDDETGFSRMAADWRAGFSLEPRGAATVVKAESSFKPRSPFVRLLMPIVRLRFHRAQRAILAGLKDSLETRRPDGFAATRPR